MVQTLKLQGQFVNIGEELASIEEFILGEGVYEEKGKVRASQIGKVFYDMINRRVNVISLISNNYNRIKKAKYLVGQVINTKDELAIIYINLIDDTKISSGIHVRVHVSEASNKYISTIREAMKVGDIVRLKLLNHTPPLFGTIKQNSLGVLIAFCGNCGEKMKKENDENVRCPVCNNVERRKLTQFNREKQRSK